ncbi:glycosyltransferase [Candidatus Amesbacteria bacterium]|nr:glycosyltransferase [Candidatus Amesbacteria bacterium]
MKKLSLSIGIPAFNEEANIGQLISDIQRQKLPGLLLKEVIVSSDGSTDKTAEIVKSFSSRNIKLINNLDRQGISRGLNQIIRRASGDILIFLDADIHISDTRFIEKLANPLIRSGVDLASPAIKELPVSTFIVQVLAVSMRLKDILFATFNNGRNIYTCKGPARALSRRFYSKLIFPPIVGVDRHSYLACERHGFKYQFVPQAVAFYQLPQNFSDHQKQSLRFFKSLSDHDKLFSHEFVKSQLRIPFNTYVHASFKALPILIKYPLHSLVYFFIQFYIKILSLVTKPVSDKWDMAVSSKKLQ